MPLKTSRRDSTTGPSGSSVGVGRAVDGLRLAGEGREVDLDAATEEACVGGDPVALADDDDVAGHERGRVDDADVAVANDGRLLREIALERLDSPARLPLLGEGEDGVEQDHRDDRRAEHRRARDEGETGRDPEQQGQRVDQLVEDLARPLAAPAAAQLVRPVGEEPARSLALGQPFRADAEIEQKSLDRLPRIARQRGLADRQPSLYDYRAAMARDRIGGCPSHVPRATTDAPRATISRRCRRHRSDESPASAQARFT